MYRFLLLIMKRLNLEQQQRMKKLLKKYGIILVVGLAYLVFTLITSWRIPCVFYVLSGRYCPGCGVTRMCIAMARLDLKAAMGHNLLVFCMLPFLLTLLVSKSVAYVKNGSEGMGRGKIETVFYLVAFALCIVFTIMRNMPAYDWLAP